jgi:hypothetical protein
MRIEGENEDEDEDDSPSIRVSSVWLNPIFWSAY